MNNPIYKFAVREDLQDIKDQVLPQKGEPLATGFDVGAFPTDRKPIIVRPGEYCKVPLGFRCYISEGWWYNLVPRSSSFIKKHMNFLYGVVDEAYNHEACAVFQYNPPTLPNRPYEKVNNLVINFGDKIGQIIPVKRQEMIVESISNEELEEMYKKRGAVRDGGFGSTNGKK